MRKEPVTETVSNRPKVPSQNPGPLYIERALAQAFVINTRVNNVFSHTDPLSELRYFKFNLQAEVPFISV